MSGRKPRGGPRPLRRLAPGIECLDSRELLSIGIGHPVGHYVAPATTGPRVPGPSPTVEPSLAVNKVLMGVLQISPQTNPVLASTSTQGNTAQSALGNKIFRQPYINSVLSNFDTFQLLQSQAMSSLVGSEQVGTNTQNADSVIYTLPQADIQIGTDTSLVVVPASNGAAGFIAQVPTTGIRLLPDGNATVAIPRSQIPPGAPLPTVTTVPTGSLGDVYAATGPLFAQALSTGSGRQGPTAPPTVPGLRLIRQLSHNRNFSTAGLGRFLHMFRVGVARDLFTLSSDQQGLVTTALGQFTTTVNQMNQTGAFQPAVPPVAPTPARGRLGGTLEISLGAMRRLANVATPLSGLQLPGVGNFPGRIDVGYVFDRHGNYGLALTARGPLLSAPANLASADLVGGDIQTEVSNAPSLTALNGTRTVEGVTLGTIQSGALSASTNASGVHTFAASTGYASGFEFGTGVAYTQVIPLGNVFALIPQAPK